MTGGVLGAVPYSFLFRKPQCQQYCKEILFLLKIKLLHGRVCSSEDIKLESMLCVDKRQQYTGVFVPWQTDSVFKPFAFFSWCSTIGLS